MLKNKLGNKGFAVTSVLYTLLVAFLLFLGAALAEFSTATKLLSKANEDLTDGFDIKAVYYNNATGDEINTYSINVSDFPYNYQKQQLTNKGEITSLSFSLDKAELTCGSENATISTITYGTVKSICKGASDVTLNYFVNLASVVPIKCTAVDSSYGVGTEISCGEEKFYVLGSNETIVGTITKNSLKEQTNGSCKQGTNPEEYTEKSFGSVEDCGLGYKCGYWYKEYGTGEYLPYKDVIDDGIKTMIDSYTKYLKEITGNDAIKSENYLFDNKQAELYINEGWFSGGSIPPFWTKTVVSDREAFVIDQGSITNVPVETKKAAVRPIIYFPKSVIN